MKPTKPNQRPSSGKKIAKVEENSKNLNDYKKKQIQGSANDIPEVTKAVGFSKDNPIELNMESFINFCNYGEKKKEEEEDHVEDLKIMEAVCKEHDNFKELITSRRKGIEKISKSFTTEGVNKTIKELGK